jgi:hypothetical protein
MSDVFDEAISRQSPPNDPARVAAVVASDPRFEYFGTAAFAVRLLRLDQKIVSGMPMSLKRLANVLNVDAIAAARILRSAFAIRRQDADAVR